MQINKIKHVIDNDMLLQEIIIEVIITDLGDVNMLEDLIETYRNQHELLEDRTFKIELNKILTYHLRPEY